MESTDYDRFEYKHFDQPALALDEAVRTAARLRASDAARVHRIVPADSDMTSFHVESISRDTLYAQLVGRWAELFNRFVSRPSAER